MLAKIVKTVLAPANLFALLLLLAAFAGMSHDERCQTIGRRSCFLLALFLFFFAVLPTGRWALLPLENRFSEETPKRVEGVILLAGDENPFLTEARKQPVLHDSAARYIGFAALAREHPKARLAFIGGSSNLETPGSVTNTDVARMALKAVGIPLERVTFEEKSRNTYENATFGAEVIKPKPGQNWLLVTAASHMPRALLTFRKAGWNVYPAPVDYRSTERDKNLIGFNVQRHFSDVNWAMHEYAGLLAYWMLGRIDNPWKK